jgi:hypothetical protein
MAFRYELRYTDGDDAGSFETIVPDWCRRHLPDR